MIKTGLFQFLIFPNLLLKALDQSCHCEEYEKKILSRVRLNHLKIKELDRYVTSLYFESGAPTAEAMNDIAVTGEQKTTEKTVTLDFSPELGPKRASLISTITALNNSANAQKIDVAIEARQGSGSFAEYYNQDDVIGFGAVDGATSSILAISDLTALVDDLSATYGFRCSINQSSANSVRYTTQHVLIISYAFF